MECAVGDNADPIPVVNEEEKTNIEAQNDGTDERRMDLPFLVTHWLAHYQRGDAAASSSSTPGRTAEETQAIRRIHRAAADLSSAFQALGSFGTTTRVSMEREFFVADCRRTRTDFTAKSSPASTISLLFPCFLLTLHSLYTAVIEQHREPFLWGNIQCGGTSHLQRSSSTMVSSVSPRPLGTFASLGCHNGTRCRETRGSSQFIAV